MDYGIKVITSGHPPTCQYNERELKLMGTAFVLIMNFLPKVMKSPFCTILIQVQLALLGILIHVAEHNSMHCLLFYILWNHVYVFCF